MAAPSLTLTNQKHLSLLVSRPVTTNICHTLLSWSSTRRWSVTLIGASVYREKTGIIKLWALWQDWRGKSWIMPLWSSSGAGPGRGPQAGEMTAVATRKSKPNESRSFPDLLARRDAAAAHLPHTLCDNLLPLLDFTLNTTTTWLLSVRCHSESVPRPPSGIHFRKLFAFWDNVKNFQDWFSPLVVHLNQAVFFVVAVDVS